MTLVKVCVRWTGHPRLLIKKKKKTKECDLETEYQDSSGTYEDQYGNKLINL